MSYDYALNSAGDWLLAANRDLDGVDGPSVTRQSIVIRLKVPRGSWVHDEDGVFGSDLDLTTATIEPERAAVKMQDTIMQALDAMDEITVTNVQIIQDEEDITKVSAQISYVLDAPSTIPTIDVDDELDPLVDIGDTEPVGEEFVTVIPL